MERYIAVDNVCAWPNLTLMRDGRVIATVFNQPCHGHWEGDVECWESADGGRTWKLCGIPATHEPGTNRMNVAAGLAGNGDLIVIASGWSDRPPRGESRPGPKFGPNAQVLPSWVCRSSDGGRTWTHEQERFPAPEGDAGIVPFGKIIRLPDGTLAVSGYSFREKDERKERSHLLSSRDDGGTWGRHVLIGAPINETDVLHVGGERLIAVGRTRPDARLDLFESDDLGRTWRRVGPLSGPSEHPGHLLGLRDGRVLLTYGVRRQNCRGIAARLSDDGGRTWSVPTTLLHLEGAADCGYPSSVQLDDETIVTAYYASGVAAHTRYHMGVIRWRPDEFFRVNRAAS